MSDGSKMLLSSAGKISDIRLGIPTMSGGSWMGGVNYIINLVTAVTSVPLHERPKVYLVVTQGRKDELDIYNKIFGLVDGFIYMGQEPGWVEPVIKTGFVHCATDNELFEHIDILFPDSRLAVQGRRAISWIADFQYLYLPQFFSEDGLNTRYTKDKGIAEKSKMIVFSSRDAQKDFHSTFPNSKAGTEVMHFHIYPDHTDYSIDPAAIQAQYGLPDRFLICCNQFWKHKDHVTLFKAISILKQRGIFVNLVCTGSVDDHRNKGYFEELQEIICLLGIEKQVFILGLIDRQDQLQLIRRSMALVQPSLFEGWSTVIEDGRLLGKTIFASDIAVNIEQAPEHGHYFKRHDAEDLAETLLSKSGDMQPGPDIDREADAKLCAYEFVGKYGRDVCDIVLKACRVFGCDPKISNVETMSINHERSKLVVKGKCDNLTIFSAPKPFGGKTDVLQRNAIKSWTELTPRPEIILFGDEQGIKEVAEEFGVRHVPTIKRNEFGTPLVSDIFEQAGRLASNDVLTYVNGDILLMDDFSAAAARVAEKFSSFLMTGRRWNLDVHGAVDFDNPNWQDVLSERAMREGELFMPRAMDYFAFTRDMCDRVEPFALGRPGWDNWLAYRGLLYSNLIDSTQAVIAIHQNHDFNHIAGGLEGRRQSPESQRNYALAGTRVFCGMGATDDAIWRLSKDGFVQCKPRGYSMQIDELCDRLEEKGWEKKIPIYKKYFESVSRLRNVERPDISIVVVSWRYDPDTLRHFEVLNSQRQDNYELIFVDNGGKAGEFDHLKPYVDTYVKLNENTGACISRNIGSLFGKADIYLYLDDDGIPGQDVVKRCKMAFAKYDIVAVRGSVWPRGKNAQPYSGIQNYGDKPFPCFSCQEGISAYDALTFYKVGGWNDKIVFGHEGLDMSRRLLFVAPDMRKQIFDPAIVLYHDQSTEKDVANDKDRKKSEAEQWLKQILPDYKIFQKYYKLKYFQRTDALIHKNVGGFAQQDSAEHIYTTERAKVELKKHGISEFSDETLQLNEQAKALVTQGDTAAALNLLKKAIEIDPAFVVGYNNMGIIYCQAGALQNALRAFTTSLNIDPLNAETVMHTAKILDATGDSPRARALLVNYLRDNPNNEQVLSRLSSMKDVRDTNTAAQTASSVSEVDKIHSVNFVRGIDDDQGKIFVIPLKPEFMPATMAWPYPAHNDYYSVEQDFLAYLYSNNELLTHDWRKAKWHYLPVYWQHWMFNHKYGERDLHLLDAELKRCIADDTKTFTVCAYSNISQVHIGRSTLMLSSRNIDAGIDIPLLCTYHKLPKKLPPKRYLANFVGRLSTGDVRGQMLENLKGRNDIFLADSEAGTEHFVQAMLESYIALSPRGYGGDSFRFYEAMQLGTMPFFIGDLDTRPFKRFIDWGQVSLYAPDASNINDIIESVSKERLMEMGKNAGKLFAEKLAYQKWCAYALKELQFVASQRTQRQEILI